MIRTKEQVTVIIEKQLRALRRREHFEELAKKHPGTTAAQLRRIATRRRIGELPIYPHEVAKKTNDDAS